MLDLRVPKARRLLVRTARTSASSFVYDVFPTTLDEFAGMEWDAKLPVQKDSDGDGLLDVVEAIRGTNPRASDTDGDGVPDQTEVIKGTNPRLSDTDGDAMSDRDELIIGSDPTLVDSDGDGLSDKSEVDGWLFTYGRD